MDRRVNKKYVAILHIFRMTELLQTLTRALLTNCGPVDELLEKSQSYDEYIRLQYRTLPCDHWVIKLCSSHAPVVFARVSPRAEERRERQNVIVVVSLCERHIKTTAIIFWHPQQSSRDVRPIFSPQRSVTLSQHQICCCVTSWLASCSTQMLCERKM